MATIQRYVNTASTAGGDGTTNNTTGATRAYASLNEWESNATGASTDDYIVDCCGTAADTTAVTLNFAIITTGSVTIRGNRSDPAGFYTGNTVISSSFYRLAPASGNPIDIAMKNVTIDGIQIEASGGSFASGISVVNAPGNWTIRKCRIRAASATDSGIGQGNAVSGGVNATFIVEDCLIVGFNTQSIEIKTPSFFSPNITIRQNTLYGDGSSFGITVADQANASATYTIKGNAIGNTGVTRNCFNISAASGTVTYDDNCTEDAQGTNGEIAIGTLTDAWTSPGTTAASDFSVKNTSSSLYNVVNPTLVTTDITDYTRDGTNHDAGAFELVIAAGSPANLSLPSLGRGVYQPIILGGPI